MTRAGQVSGPNCWGAIVFGGPGRNARSSANALVWWRAFNKCPCAVEWYATAVGRFSINVANCIIVAQEMAGEARRSPAANMMMCLPLSPQRKPPHRPSGFVDQYPRLPLHRQTVERVRTSTSSGVL
jgi:hypothetical protein